MLLRKIGPVLAASFAISLFGISLGTGAAAAADGTPAPAANREHHAYAGHRLYNYAGAAALTPRALPADGRYSPPLQDPQDAWGGYFANPDDNPGFLGDNGG